MAKPKQVSQARRGFLKTAAGAAALAGVAPAVKAEPQAPARPAAQPPSAGQSAAETATPSIADMQIVEHPGSDFMVDVIKSLGIEYVFANPGSSFRGLHESMINYGGNSSPEFITCMHEDSSVAMANGYAKIEGKPVLVCVHGTVGLQHAAMSIYNAYCDQAPVIIVGGIIPMQPNGAGAWNGCTAHRTSPPWCATLPSGTTIRSRCSTSPSRSCAVIRSP